MPIIDLIPDVVELVAGADHHCLRTADERMTCFGSNQFGQLGALPPNIWLTPRTIE
jgi:alpha-tubulin suppressor-like RCC1 family protein